MRNESIEAASQNGVALRVEFDWQRDRYGHTLLLVDPSGAATPLLKSIEGVSQNDWPPSPPLQTLSIEKLSDQRIVALLVGMAGRGHWSASVEPQSGEATIVFDLACRYTPNAKYPLPPQQLGSRYLAISPLVPSQLSIESSDASVVDASGVIEIVPTAIAAAGTTRWRFVVSTKY